MSFDRVDLKVHSSLDFMTLHIIQFLGLFSTLQSHFSTTIAKAFSSPIALLFIVHFFLHSIYRYWMLCCYLLTYLLSQSLTNMGAPFGSGVLCVFLFWSLRIIVGVINVHLYFQFSCSLPQVSVSHGHTLWPPSMKLGMATWLELNGLFEKEVFKHLHTLCHVSFTCHRNQRSSLIVPTLSLLPEEGPLE